VASESNKQPVKSEKKRSGTPKQESAGWTKPFRAIGGYFKGAWEELRQVRWPNRAATWGLTLAVILFSIFFAAVILGLDSGFSYLFKEILL